MRGYYSSNDLFNHFKEKTEPLSVVCDRCRNTWLEDVTHYGILAGYARHYDYCDKCITPEEVKQKHE